MLLIYRFTCYRLGKLLKTFLILYDQSLVVPLALELVTVVRKRVWNLSTGHTQSLSPSHAEEVAKPKTTQNRLKHKP